MKSLCEECRSRKRTPLHCLGHSAWAAFLTARSLHRIPERQIVFREGMPASTVYVLCDGQVKLSIKSHGGNQSTLRLLSGRTHPCEILDKAALGMATHSVTCETLTASWIACLDKAQLTRLMRSDERFAALLVEALVAEVIWSRQALRDRMTSARRRAAKRLIELGAEHPDGFPLRRQEMAEAIGTARETVARLLSTFARERLIAVNGRHIEILAPDRLRRVAGDSVMIVTSITSGP
ncbi:MAG: cAMP-binding protein [Nitrospiraceae bacterium]|nr:MAG: cAMP-binding protein [Nitrospiraceae bacterium]